MVVKVFLNYGLKLTTFTFNRPRPELFQNLDAQAVPY